MSYFDSVLVPRKEDLERFSAIRLKKKRLKKKFSKHYRKYLPEKVFLEYWARTALIKPLMGVLEYNLILKEVVRIEKI